MAPKKTPQVVSEAVVSDATVDVPAVVDQTAGKSPKVRKTPVKPRAKKAVKSVPTTSEATDSSDADLEKKRVMSAVSSDFVNSVEKLLSEDLSAKLKAKDIKAVCEAFVKTLVGEVKEGKTVTFTNNVTFKRVLRGARTHKNPRTGAQVEKPAHYVMTMEVKPALKRSFAEVVVAAQ